MSQPLEGNLPQSDGVTPIRDEQAVAKRTLDALQSQIFRLETQLEELQEQVRTQRNIIFPIQSLPTEILGPIFLFVVPDVVLDSKGREALLQLNLVCRSWRSASLLTHRLWSGVQIRPMDTEYDRISTWLERSGKVSKTVEFNKFIRSNNSPPDWRKCECTDGEPCYSTNAVLRRLLTEGPILHHFKLECSSTQCYLNWIASLSSVPRQPSTHRPWDHLIAFELAFDFTTTWVEPTDPSQSIFYHLPPTPTLLLNLPSSFTAFEEPAHSVDVVLYIPLHAFATLTTLNIKCDWMGTHIIDILEHCPQLESVTINSNSTSPDDEPTHRLETLAASPLLLPKLHTMHFEQVSKLDILKYIRAPQLRHMRLEWPSSHTDSLPDCSFAKLLSFFIHECNLEGTLESLHLSNLCTLTDHFGFVLSNLWGLQHLTLERVIVPGVWVVWQLFHQRAKAAASVRDEAPQPSFKGRQYLPSLRKLELLQIPDQYRLEWVGIYLTARKEGIPCNVTVSYEAKNVLRKRQDDFFKMLVESTKKHGVRSTVTIL